MNYRINLTGLPGSGKGSISEAVKERLGIPCFSTGDILRGAERQGTLLGKLYAEHCRDGGFIPDSVIIPIVQTRLYGLESYLLEGFPRTVPQAQAFQRFSRFTHVTELYLSPEAEQLARKRIDARWICSDSGNNCKVYGLTRPAPENRLCLDCGSPLKKRDDDAPEKVGKRFALYHELTEPVIAFYKPLGIVHRVDASQKIEKEIADVLSALGVNGQA